MSPATLSSMSPASLSPMLSPASLFPLQGCNGQSSLSQTLLSLPFAGQHSLHPAHRRRTTTVSKMTAVSRAHASPLLSGALVYVESQRTIKKFQIRAVGDGEKSGRRSSDGEQRETIMLPGCDYNHWLIVMEFPKDPAPTREQMIDTYLNTLATVVGSMEDAKKNMYAFSTTTYTGFQCTVDEATSEKFKGMPGVLWVLPDSYIDVKNKDYGGDKYINGEIIPCKYPTYQPKQRNNSKYESRRYERRRDGPPGSTTRQPKQEATPSEASS